MIIFTKREIKKQQLQCIRHCIESVHPSLDSGEELFHSFFPDASIAVIHDSKATQKIKASSLINHKIKRIKEWIDWIFEMALEIYNDKEFEAPALKAIQLPPSMSYPIMETILKIFSTGRDLLDTDYYYIADVAYALAMEPEITLRIIDQVQYETRMQFFGALLEYLSDEECFQCATLLYKAIQADQKMHPAEFKYVENISQLLRNDQFKLDAVEELCKKDEPLPEIKLEDDLTQYLFKYLIEIIMCDEDYAHDESVFVSKIAALFNYDKERQEAVIQPAAAALIIKNSLFAKA